MPVITIISDWGTKDHYLASLKGSILSQLPEARIVDITHEVTQFDFVEAAFILRNCYESFPAGTVHIIGINCIMPLNHERLAVQIGGHYFIGTDNGIFALLSEERPEHIISLKSEDEQHNLFPIRQLFVTAACTLASGKPITSLGKSIHTLVDKTLLNPVIDNNMIRGSVIYVDGHDNVITNITRKLFDDVGKGRSFVIYSSNNYHFNVLSNTYSEVPEGEKLAMFNSGDYLELAIRQGQVTDMLGIKFGHPIRVEFNGDANR